MPTNLPSFEEIVLWAQQEYGYDVTRHAIDDAEHPMELVVFNDGEKRFSVPHFIGSPSDWGDWDTLVEKLSNRQDMYHHGLLQAVMDSVNDKEERALVLGRKRLRQYKDLKHAVGKLRRAVRIENGSLYPSRGYAWSGLTAAYEELCDHVNKMDAAGSPDDDSMMSNLANIKHNSDFLLDIAQVIGITQAEIDARDDFYALCSQVKFKIQQLQERADDKPARDTLNDLSAKYLFWSKAEIDAYAYPPQMIGDALARRLDQERIERSKINEQLKDIADAVGLSDAFRFHLTRAALVERIINELKRGKDARKSLMEVAHHISVSEPQDKTIDELVTAIKERIDSIEKRAQDILELLNNRDFTV